MTDTGSRPKLAGRRQQLATDIDVQLCMLQLAQLSNLLAGGEDNYTSVAAEAHAVQEGVPREKDLVQAFFMVQVLPNVQY